MKIALTYKSAYGNDRYYPNCADSSVICKLAGFKSFTPAQIELMKRESWEVEVEGFKPEKAG